MHSDELDRIFEVKIGANKSVTALKKAIKEEKSQTFQDVQADSLVLWKVSLPFDGTFNEKLGLVHLGYDYLLKPFARPYYPFRSKPTLILVICVFYSKHRSKVPTSKLTCSKGHTLHHSKIQILYIVHRRGLAWYAIFRGPLMLLTLQALGRHRHLASKQFGLP